MKYMRAISRFLLASILVLFFNGCGAKAGTEPEDSVQPISFTIGSGLKGISPDSLFVSMQVGDSGAMQNFTFDWRSGVANRTLSASVGEKFKIQFKLYACKSLIAQGETSGVFEKEMAIPLHPIWNDSAIAAAKLCRNSAQCLMADPSTIYSLALAGKAFSMPTACDSVAIYRWVIRQDNDTVLTGSGSKISFVLPDSLNGSKLSVKIQLVLGDSITEERKWTISVIDALPSVRIKKMTFKNDTLASWGSSQVYSYDEQGRLTSIAIYDTLTPTVAARSTSTESLFYDGSGRLKMARRYLPDSTRIDSNFSYDASGHLVTLGISGNGTETLDSLWYSTQGKIIKSIRYISKQRSDSVIYVWNGSASRKDSVFSRDGSRLTLARVFQNQFQGDSLVSRKVWVNKNGLQAYRSEKWVFNALNQLAVYQDYSEGQIATLESSITYAFDSKGVLISAIHRDEVMDETLLAVHYEFEGLAKANGQAKQAVGHLSKAVLPNLQFAFEGWRLKPHPQRAQR